MVYFRSLIFNIYFIIWTFSVALLGLPIAYLFPPLSVTHIVGRIWSLGTAFGLKYLCNLTMELRGYENITSGPYIFASKHQSALETIIYLSIIPNPTFVLKKELTLIPIVGTYFKRMGMIIVNRAGKANALKDLLKKSKEAIANNRSIIIFPEGTRTKIGETKAYHPGVTAIYSNNNVPVIPIALNTGYFWGKNGYLKKPGRYIFEFLPPIQSGLSKEDFIQTLTEAIESNSTKLIKT